MASKFRPNNVSDFKILLKRGDPHKLFDAGMRNKMELVMVVPKRSQRKFFAWLLLED